MSIKHTSATALLFFLLLFSFYLQAQQTQTDSYTQYELLAPDTQSFRIVYDVSGTTSGAKYYWNTLRKGSEHTVNKVWDLFSGKTLVWEIVDGKTAAQNGLANAFEDTDYLQVTLARPIPNGGQARIRIDKTYKDPASYFSEGNTIVFSRSLGIKRNSIILPAGYELTHCNYPSQVQLTDDARIKVSFLNRDAQAVPLAIKATKLTSKIELPQEESYVPTNGSGRDASKARLGWQFNERAFQNRDIVYFLQQPETHSFLLYHDYTETRPGIDRYINVVRPGSKASKPSAIILDTGEELKVETLKGEAISKRGITINSEITPETEVVAIWYDPLKEGETKRLRITETYTDANRYMVYKNQLVWDRSFGRNRNTVVLPFGWFLTTSSIPAIISQNEDGLTTLRFVNDRPDLIDVYIKAQRKNQ
ncbi:hypothetical protein [Flagellimonas sp. CMM7]|uniref:hypothetical protein n=1 Tax=Flagellimonas sp. CMM7 TaxID=2654676 RepID=UPI0013D48CB9|nr:hypothetical protein [Flagellimonas sp. CMM7]UII78038.1 hypothetical protein LV704_10180 [Flagellimonas sp. CMM7]